MQALRRLSTVCTRHTVLNKKNEPIRNAWKRHFVQSSANRKENSLETLYTDEEKIRILQSFNKCSEQELQITKQFNSQKANSLVKYRVDNGEFQTLTDILKVPGIGILSLQKVCNILKSVEYDSLQELKTKQDSYRVKCQPPLSQEQIKNLDTIVAIETNVDNIVWTKMNRQLTLLDWGHTPVFDKPIQKYDPAVFLEKIQKAAEKIPEGDIFVMEGKIYRFPNIRIVPFLTNLRITEAMLFTILNKDFSSTREHRVYCLPTVAVSKLFSLTVGGERVSGQHIIRDIQRHNSDHGEISVPQDSWRTYLDLDKVQQEKYSNCFLLALAFFQLVVLKSHSV